MRIIGIILGVLVTLVVAAAIIVPSLVSKDDILLQVSEKVETATSRTLSVNGDSKLSFFPSLIIELNDVKFANAEQGTAPDMASMEKLSLHVPWASVLTGTLVVEQFVIDDLNLVLEKFSETDANWQLSSTAATEGPAEVEDAPIESSSGGPTQLPAGFDISLGQVQINGGSITFNDHIGQTTEVIDQLALEVLLPSLRKPLKVNGQIRYKLQTFKTDIVLETPAKAIEGETFNTDLSMNSDLVNVTYSGSVAQHPIAVEGKLSVAGDSVKQIALWQEVPMETKDNAFNQFSLDAAFTYSGNTFDMTELVARLDELDIKGNTTVYLESVPRIVSTVNLGDLNLNPYLPEPTEQAAPETTEATPIVWDDTPIDLSGLGAVNADLTITSSSLQTREVKLGANKFTLKMQDSVLNIAMEEFNAYEGKGVSKITVNGTRKPYRIDTDFDLSGIDFLPLLTDAAGFDKLMGKGQFKWQLSTSGESQKGFVEALNGSVNFDIKDGAVKGANLAAIAESAQEALTGNFAGVNLDQDYNNAQKTDFASLTGSIQFNDGVGNIKEVALLNPLIRVTAEGVANLPTTRLDMKSSTRLVASTRGQGGTTDESGIHIPIKIYGAFHDVKVKPDMSALFKDKAKEGLKDKVVDKLKGLFGGGD